MLIRMGKSFGPKNIEDLSDVLVNKARFIIISDIKSNSIPDLYNLIFNIMSGNGFGNDGYEKSKISVINVSESRGSIHNKRDRLRSVIVHTGTCDCSPEEINLDSVISFEQVDYNAFSTGIGNGGRSDLIDGVLVSYDKRQPLIRASSSNADIIIPTPNYYEEYDQIKLSGDETNHVEVCDGLSYYSSIRNAEMWDNNIFRIKIRDLIDNYTKIRKIIFNIEKIGFGINGGEPIVTNAVNTGESDLIHNYACELKYILETSCFSSATIFLSIRGFKIMNIKSYMSLSTEEASLNFTNLNFQVDMLNSRFKEEFFGIEMITNIRHDKVSVKIYPVVNNSYLISDEGDGRTDYLTDEMSTTITSSLDQDKILDWIK